MIDFANYSFDKARKKLIKESMVRLGPDAVKRGMRTFDQPGWMRFRKAQLFDSCFVGHISDERSSFNNEITIAEKYNLSYHALLHISSAHYSVPELVHEIGKEYLAEMDK